MPLRHVQLILGYFARYYDGELPLCRSCAGVLPLAGGIPPLHEYLLHKNLESLIASSSSCGLCKLVGSQLRQMLVRASIKDFTMAADNVSRHPVALSAHKTYGKIWIKAYGLQLRELQWFAEPGKQGSSGYWLKLSAYWIIADEAVQ
jgi:hypothetical protein